SRGAPSWPRTCAPDPGRSLTRSSSREGLSCRFALAPWTEIGEAGLLALRSYSNRGSAAWTGPAATPMNRMALPGDRCHEVGTHQIASGEVEAAKPPVIELGRKHAGVQFERPERFALIDVADASADPLL